MNYLKRKIDQFLLDWRKDANRKPLIVQGTRQIGKTASIRHFAAANYEQVIEVNFFTNTMFKRITERGFSPDSIIKEISLIDRNAKFVPSKTLIFFDEIQVHPDIVSSFKFFKEDGRFDVIASGSLLGVSAARMTSYPVGFVKTYEMKSLDFEEFLWALGHPAALSEEILSQMLARAPFSSVQTGVLGTAFNDYILLGGMPEVVSSFVREGTFGGAWEIQQEILRNYEWDITKYAEGVKKTKILSVFRQIPSQLAKDNKRFQYTKLSNHARGRDYFGCVEWLESSGIAIVCSCMSFPELPIEGNLDVGRFKLYMADTGLLIASLEEEVRDDVRRNRNIGVFGGALYENIAAEALVKQGYRARYYRKEDSTLEQDFFVRTAEELIPVEVKKSNNRATTIKTLITSDHYPDIRRGIKFANANIGTAGEVTTFPHFCLFLLKRFLSQLAPCPRADAFRF